MRAKHDRPGALAEPALPANGVADVRPEDDGVLEDWEPLPDLSFWDDEEGPPVASVYAERQQALFVEPLHSSWGGPGEGRPFLALSNVGLIYRDKTPALFPDGLLSLDVTGPADVRSRPGRFYHVWIYGKPPDVVLELVSDRRGDEDTLKLRRYAALGIAYYVIYDPDNHLRGGVLRVLERKGSDYVPLPDNWLPGVGLGVTLWQGTYAGVEAVWLRWCDRDGNLIPTGAERAEQEKQRAEQEKQRALDAGKAARREKQRAKKEKQRADDMAKKLEAMRVALRAAGLEPPV